MTWDCLRAMADLSHWRGLLVSCLAGEQTTLAVFLFLRTLYSRPGLGAAQCVLPGFSPLVLKNNFFKEITRVGKMTFIYLALV